MNCPECGKENAQSAKFCKYCGADLTAPPTKGNDNSENKIVSHKTDDSKKNTKIIIAVLAVVVIVLAGLVIYASGILTPEIPLETQEFDQFTIDVPVESKFVLGNQHTTDKDNIIVMYDNKGKYSNEAYAIDVGNNLTEDLIADGAELIEETSNAKIYKYEDTYEILANFDESQILLIGSDLDTLKRMADSYKEGDISKLASNETSSTTPDTSSQKTTQAQPATPSTPATTAISILGGSFSTGSGLKDKTYAKIYVGPEHAGEKVKIQIWYSRDGSYLNNGNMVPKTVTSDGYIEVASADAYNKYPDFAEINIYDSSGTQLIDAYSVSLNPDSGTQTF
jgi:hypothetical protein